MNRAESVTIRQAVASDELALQRLATLDSAPAPVGRVLVAEVDGELWAAVEVDGGRAIADPFRPSGSLVEVLRLRAEPLRDGAGTRRALRLRLLPRVA